MRHHERTIDPSFIAEYVDSLYGRKRYDPNSWTITLAITGEGYVVGVADYGESGYVDTGLIVDEHNYDKAYAILEEARKILLPGMSADRHFDIEISSMRN